MRRFTVEINEFRLVQFNDARKDTPFLLATPISWGQKLLMFRDDGRLFILAGITTEGAHWYPVKENMCVRLQKKNPSILYVSIINNEAIPFLFSEESEITEMASGHWLVMPLHYIAPLG